MESEDFIYWQREGRKGRLKGKWEKEENKLKSIRETTIYYLNLISQSKLLKLIQSKQW